MSMLQLNPPIPIRSVMPECEGDALAHFIIDYGPENDLIWVCCTAKNECWCIPNPMMRFHDNATMMRKAPVTAAVTKS